MSRIKTFLVAVAMLSLTAPLASAQERREFRDVVYATVDGTPLAVDIYMPAGVQSPPLIVWVHGGAWRGGSRTQVQLGFVDAGFAMASVQFRQSTEARFPAQVHDIKAAIRFLRAHAADYGYRTDRIAISGPSSGGHLAALVGVSNNHPELEGTVGDHPEQSSSIQSIVNYFGPTNLETILAQSTPFGLNVREPALDLLLGGRPEDVAELAKLASPVAHVDANDPPLLNYHGDRDPQVPINQAHELHAAYKDLGLDVHFEVVHGAAHGGGAFYDPARLQLALDFLKRTIGN